MPSEVLALESVIYTTGERVHYEFRNLPAGSGTALATLKVRYRRNSSAGWTDAQVIPDGQINRLPDYFTPANRGQYMVVLRFRFRKVSYRYATEVIEVG